MTDLDNLSTEKSVRVGVFEDLSQADQAVRSLIEAGFGSDEITVISRDDEQQQHFNNLTLEARDADSTDLVKPPATECALDRAASGGAIGGSLGGLVALAGLATVAGAPVLIAGAMAGALTGGVVGGLAGAMSARGIAKEPADFFDQAVSEGHLLVSVEPLHHDPQRLHTASQMLRAAGATPLSLLEG